MADVENEELLDYDEEDQTTETPAGNFKNSVATYRQLRRQNMGRGRIGGASRLTMVCGVWSKAKKKIYILSKLTMGQSR